MIRKYAILAKVLEWIRITPAQTVMVRELYKTEI